ASSLATLPLAALSAGAACTTAPLPPTRQLGVRRRSSPTSRCAPLPPAGPRAPPLEMDGNTLYNELEVMEGMKLLIHDKKVNLHAVAKVVELALKSNGLRLFCSNRSKSLCLLLQRI
ncbi:hypothetical protein EE612_058411, partial [Oryza sativa]